MNTANKQILFQILGRKDVTVIFKNHWRDMQLSLYNTQAGWMVDSDTDLLQAKPISETLAFDLVAQFTDEQQFNTDAEVIRTDLDRMDFCERYLK